MNTLLSQSVPSSKRIEYIDAMRGFTMILVVLNHVSGFCLGIEETTPSVNTFFKEFRMPLFYFVSGFVLYKANVIWNAHHIISFLKKKFPVQIVSTFIFIIAFVISRKANLMEALYSDSKSGYWFTITLFEYYIFYSFIRFLLYITRCNEKVAQFLIVLWGGTIWLVSLKEQLFFPHDISQIMCINKWEFFLYFCIGTVVRKYFSQSKDILQTTPIILFSLLFFFGLNLNHEYCISNFKNFFKLITAISGIIIVLSFFMRYELSLNKQHYIGRILQYIGKRTLDIYLIHYFLLPTSLIQTCYIFIDYPMPVLELFVSTCISLIIIAVCLVISNVLRLSPTLAHLLFGVKKITNARQRNVN